MATISTPSANPVDRMHAYEAELDVKLAAGDIDEDDYERLQYAAWIHFAREAR